MNRTIALFFSAVVATGAVAQDAPETDVVALWEGNPTMTFDATSLDLEEFAWRARPVVVFADSPDDPAFRQQMDLLADHADALADRGVIVVTDTDPSARSALRQRLRPRGFSMVLIGKDGEVKLRKPSPWDVREISRSIDKMPMRQQEVADERRGG